MSDLPAPRRAAVLTLGCARNEVDSEEIAGRLEGSGWELVDVDPDDNPDGVAADVIIVNTCGFIEQAKKDSIDTLLAASDVAKEHGAKVVAVGCLAERYGKELADSLPEADAVLGFDAYPDLAERLVDVLDGHAPEPHIPVDRRTLLPITPVERPAAAAEVAVPGHGWMSGLARTRLKGGPVANVKLASGCDRKCAFCAIPSFRGAFVSRPPDDVVAEAAWLGTQGVREIVLVSENSTSYGKDLPGGGRALARLLPRLANVPGIDVVRVSYLQPAEMRPDLIQAIATTPGVAPYFDLSFQHASAPVLRRMRRFGSRADFLDLCARIRALNPEAGIRSNFIVGFPGETEEDLAELEAFLTEARLDAVGVFGYSDEDGTEAAGYPDKIDPEVVAERVERITALADELINQRAEEREGAEVTVLVESVGDGEATGRAAHQAPEVDGEVVLLDGQVEVAELQVGDLVRGVVTGSAGADLVVEPYEFVPRSTLPARAPAVASGSG
ncbi:30S ribosomal protein S12 methylthiotransferase RimO [Pseudonocardia thermophila]|uniref:30S ribosomal protein S12 methylthiotransferase RimO n=1 Tax=Pseudonocardia thermophila TaxID=1848 RepID=UPI00248E2DE2|nr:30S ribosomal protein S12 methylthiotransferase RimO [Pseudonocardia thermophila]